ncbi:35493_t:CDS:2, partial [Gigaspora margarita]
MSLKPLTYLHYHGMISLLLELLKNTAGSACNGENNSDFFILGGLRDYESVVIKYDINNQNWTDITSGIYEPTNRYFISCAKFNNRSIAIFGGFKSLSIASNALPEIWAYCAITLPDETILYIGGFAYNNDIVFLMPLNSLPLYDTTSNTWKSLNTSGPTPQSREFFSAVLNIATNQWSAGTISNPNGLTLRSHTATLVDNYMIVAFGSYELAKNYSSTIYILD